MRAFLLFLSQRKSLRKWLETSAFGRRLAARFVAGDTLADALETGRRINSEGISATLDHLGENVTSLAEAEASRDVYLRALEEIARNGIRCNVSLKLTQFGIDISEQACRANVEQLARRAKQLNNFVRVDMESSEYTERTLQLVTDLHAQYGTVGAVLQAYLYRSEKDIEMLSRRGIRVRLCKGAYAEPPTVAFADKHETDANYVKLARRLPDRHGLNHCEAFNALSSYRVLDVLDETSTGRRLVPVLGHLIDSADPRMAAKATLFIGKRIQSAEWAARQLTRYARFANA